MRAFASIILLFALCLLSAAALAYPVWLLIGLMDVQPIHRVLHRLAMLFAIISLVWLFRRWRVADRTSAGFGLPARNFWKQAGIGLLIGMAVIVPPLFLLEVTGARPIDPEAKLTFLKGMVRGLSTGLLVALLEEAFFRGALFTAIQRESGLALSVTLPSLLYASVHFLGGRLSVPADEITWTSGFAVLERMFIAYANPAAIMDSFIALFAVGILLALVRMRTGNIAACVGMHTAWVWALYYFDGITNRDPASGWAWLVGSYNEIIGWGTVMWMAVLAIAFLAVGRRLPARTAS